MSDFGSYLDERWRWITIVPSEFYPDSLAEPTVAYHRYIELFGRLLDESANAVDLLSRIDDIRDHGIDAKNADVRRQLLRVFKKYVCPDIPVEISKKRRNIPLIIAAFQGRFRPLHDVRRLYLARPKPDEPLVALLNEYRERGQKGYRLATDFIEWFESAFGDDYEIDGPKSAGPDIKLRKLFPAYPKARRTVDLRITERGTGRHVAVGLIRYDSDRGGAQGSDRVSGYEKLIDEAATFFDEAQLPCRLLFINDGPGLLDETMWGRYAALEEMGRGRVMVATSTIARQRLTPEWLLVR